MIGATGTHASSKSSVLLRSAYILLTTVDSAKVGHEIPDRLDRGLQNAGSRETPLLPTIDMRKAVRVFQRLMVKPPNILASRAVPSAPGEQSGCELAFLIRFSLGRFRPPGM